MTAIMPTTGLSAALEGDDLMGRALADWGGADGSLFLRTKQGRRLRFDLSTYFAPVGRRHRRLELRGEYLDAAGPWFDWLIVDLPTLVGLAAVSGWRLDLALTQGRRYWAWFTCAR